MRARLIRLLAAGSALAALAFGGAALAGAANTSPNPAPPAAANVQQGDQTSPDAGVQASESSSEQVESVSEQAESTSESAAPNDGPSGHADNPAPAGLDHQFQGEQ